MMNLCMMAATASLLAVLISPYLRKISSDLSFFLGVITNVIIERIVFFFMDWIVSFAVCILLIAT